MAEQEEKAGGGFLQGLSNDLAEVVERAGGQVVRVNARRRWPGSGILWSADGVVVTADHVVEVEEGITVGLPEGQEVPAELVGRDPGTDLAVLRVQVGERPAAELAEASSVKVGNLVLALGRPGEGGPMASFGIVSAVTGPWRTRRGGVLERLIQADVTLYPGFSGGPLVDAAGRVVGLNTSRLDRGVSVAIPSDTVQGVVQAILTQGRVKRGYLGVSTQPVPLPAGLAQSAGLAPGSGLLIVGVEPGGPADQAGLMLGDLLIALAGQRVQDAEDLQGLLGPERVGAPTQVRILRGGQLRELTVTIGERP